MDYLWGYVKAIILGIIEGATEFIPVSSTGHMIIADKYIKLSADKAFDDSFIIIIQLAAILSVVVYFWKELVPFQHSREELQTKVGLWMRIVVAFIPAAVLGLLLHKWIEYYLFNDVFVAFMLLVGGVVLIVLEARRPATTVLTVYDIGYVMAFTIGLFQCLAMLPGTSRSAATIIGAMLLGASRPAAAEFSFLLAIPTMLGATAVELVKRGAHFTGQEWTLLAVGSLTAFLVAYSVVAAFMNYVQRRDFRPFGYYRIALAVVVLAHAWWVHMH